MYVCIYIYIHTHIHTHTHTYRKKYYSAIKNEWSVAMCRNMDGLGGHYAKWNMSQKDKYCMISLILFMGFSSLVCGSKKKHNTLVNKTKKKWTLRYKE